MLYRLKCEGKIDTWTFAVVEKILVSRYYHSFYRNVTKKMRHESDEYDKLTGGQSTWKTTRSDLSWDDIHNYVNPAIAEMLEVQPKQVRQMRVIELNMLGNLHPAKWGHTGTYEWLEDKVNLESFSRSGCTEYRDYRLYGDNSSYVKNSLTGFDSDCSDYRSEFYSFRPMIIFPIQKQRP